MSGLNKLVVHYRGDHSGRSREHDDEHQITVNILEKGRESFLVALSRDQAML